MTITAQISWTPIQPAPMDYVTFHADVVGGTGPYVLSWRFSDGAQGVGNDITHPPFGDGTFTVDLTVTDSQNATGTASATFTTGAAAGSDVVDNSLTTSEAVQTTGGDGTPFDWSTVAPLVALVAVLGVGAFIATQFRVAGRAYA